VIVGPSGRLTHETADTVRLFSRSFTGSPLTWKLGDHQGTTYATVDAANLAVTKRWQDPYGLSRGTPPSTWPDKHGYIGGYQTTTGLTLNRPGFGRDSLLGSGDQTGQVA